MWNKTVEIPGMDKSEGVAISSQKAQPKLSQPTLTLIRSNGTNGVNRSDLSSLAEPSHHGFYGSLGRFAYTLLGINTKA